MTRSIWILIFVVALSIPVLAQKCSPTIPVPSVAISAQDSVEGSRVIGMYLGSEPFSVKEVAEFKEHIRQKYLRGPFCLSQGDGFCSKEGWYDGQFNYAGDGRIYAVWPDQFCERKEHESISTDIVDSL